jgi:drug/metabolite transporter (DMT)-like permease
LDQITIPNSRSPVPTNRLAIGLGLLVLYLVWGSTYLGIAVTIESIPPFLMAATRFLIAGLALLGWSWLREGRAFTLPTRREWRDSTIVGALLLGGGMGMVAWGQQTVPSGIAALMIALMPAWVAVLGRLFLGERLPRIVVAGIVIGLVGVAILIGPSADGATAFNVFGLAALVLSPIFWSGGSLFSQHRATLPSRPLVATGAQMVAGSVALAIMSFASGEFGRFDPAGVTTASLAGLTYLTVIGSLLAFTTYVRLLRVAPLPLIATYAYVNPVVAVFLGTWFLSEPLTQRTVVAGAVIVFAVALIITARSRMSSPAAARQPLPDRSAVTAHAIPRTDAAT